MLAGFSNAVRESLGANIMTKVTVGLLLLLGDVTALLLALLLASLASSTFFSDNTHHMSSIIWSQGRFFLFMAVGVLFAIYNKGHYTQRQPWWSQIAYLIKVCSLALVINGFVLFAFKQSIPSEAILLAWILSLLFLATFRQIVRLICQALGIWKIPAILLGDGQNAIDTLFALSSDRFSDYEVKTLYLRDREFDTFDTSLLPVKYQNIRILDGRNGYLKHLKAGLDQHSFYIVALDAFRGEYRDKLMGVLQDSGVEYAVVPPIKRISLHGMEPQFFFGYDVMFLRPRNLLTSPRSRLLKRLMDICISSLFLLLLSPALAFIAWKVRRDGGPATYSHVRLGQNATPFKCWKFRSMISNSQEVLDNLLATDKDARTEWEKDFKLKNDPRITPMGSFLRKTSLDELPQLWNVLKGEMSLVGPRPIVEDEQKYYGDYFKSYKAVRPGITGLWQVSGRNDTSYEHRVYLDGWYVRNWSLWHDIVILFKTVRALVKKEGAY